MKSIVYSGALLVSIMTVAPLIAADLGDPKPRAIKAKAFASGNAGFYSSILGKPYLMTRSKYSGINRRLELDKKLLGRMNSENNYAVIKETMLGWSACIKHERKFTGGHKSAVGEEMREALIAVGAIERNTYEENPLVELYEQEVPMYWQMTTTTEFSALRQSMAKRLAEKKLKPKKHAVLLVTIENDPTLARLTDEDQAFIREWFTQVSFDDGDSREYFGKMFEDMVEENYRLEGAKPEFPFESVAENLFRNFEKALGDFEQSKIIPMVAASAGGIMLTKALTGPFKEAVEALARQLNLVDASKGVLDSGLRRSGLKSSGFKLGNDGKIDISKIIGGINIRGAK